jgi:dipeptidyl-peptidase 4
VRSPQSSGRELTIEAVVRFPRPGMGAPSRFAFSPDARFLTFLYSERGDLVLDLHLFDVQSGERRLLARHPGLATAEPVTAEEALRRERQRVRETGITRYSWATRADRILIPLDGRLYVTTSAGEPLREVAGGGPPIADAALSPDGAQVVLVRERELWVAEANGGPLRRLTFDASETLSNGLAEYVAQEEMGRNAGFWISPDGSRVAYAQVDEGHIPVFPIVHQGGERWQVEEHRYPFAGEANARVRLGIMPLAGGETSWLTHGGEDAYLARVHWHPEGDLYVQVQSRDQRRLTLLRFRGGAGEPETVVLETCEPWVNLHDDLHFVGPGELIWSSERTGFRHLFLYDLAGTVIRQLTDGAWPVDRVVHVDEARRVVYFVAGRESPLERHLYAVSADGGEPTRLTDVPGMHAATFAQDGSAWVVTSENRSRPPSVQVHRQGNVLPRVLHAPEPTREDWSHLPPPELVQVPARDGTILHGALYRPRTGSGPFPTVVSVYGGPHVQQVSDSWGLTVDLRAQYLAEHGFLVFKLDNRGSARRGLAFEAAISQHLGTLEVEDQVEGVRWLVAQGLADPERVGLTGWSYGGYLTLMSLARAGSVFRAGVAGAPVVDWDGYDTHYTERYLGTPADNPEGYRQGSVLTHAEKLAGALLLVHGMIDENVHFRHSARLLSVLQESGRTIDVLLLPSERHMPRGDAARQLLESSLVEHFARHLQGEARA